MQETLVEDLFYDLQEVVCQLKRRCVALTQSHRDQCLVYLKQIIDEASTLESILSGSKKINQASLKQLDQLIEAIFYAKLERPYQGSPVNFINQAYQGIASSSEKIAAICSQLKASKAFRRHRLLCRIAPQSKLINSVYSRVWRRRILLPFLLVWDLLRYAANWAGGYFFMSRVILPGLSVKDWRDEPFILFEDDIESGFIQGIPAHYETSKYHLVLPKSTISCVDMKHTDYDSKRHKTVVYCLGNRNIFPLQVFLDDIEALEAHNEPCRLILWHYPGVFNSFGGPKRPADLAFSGLHVIQELLNEGVSPSNIVLKGHSLGGYVATHMAFCCHQQNLPVKIWSDRSFSDAQNYIFAKATVQSDSGYKPRFLLLRALVNLIYPLIWFATRLFMCEMPACFYLYTLDHSFVDYIVLRSKHQERQMQEVKDDIVIQDPASLDQSWWLKIWGRKKRLDSKKHQYQARDTLSEDAHCVPLKQLYSTYTDSNETAQDRFIQFLLRDVPKIPKNEQA